MYEELEQAEEYREIAVKDISRSEESVREGRGDPATDHELKSLMEDIKINGLTHPPTVEATPKGPKPYQTIVGSRRLVAVEQLGMKKIKCLMRPDLSTNRKDVIAFSENIHRRDYTAFERAKLIKRMLDDWGGDEIGLAKALGYSSSNVITEWLSYLGLDPKAAELLKNSNLPPKSIKKRQTMLAKLPKALQRQATELILEKAASDYDARKMVAAILKSEGSDPREVIRKYQAAPRTKTVIAYISEPLDEALEAYGGQERLVKTEVVRIAIEDFLTRNGFYKKSSSGSGA